MSTLVDISPPATADNAAIHLHAATYVAIARVPLAPGQRIRAGGVDIAANTAVPAGHKIAIRPIAAGQNIVRYGQVMGRASRDIAPGDHVHTHNVAFEELRFEYEFPDGD